MANSAACYVQSNSDQAIVAFGSNMGECNMHKHACFVNMPCGIHFGRQVHMLELCCILAHYAVLTGGKYCSIAVARCIVQYTVNPSIASVIRN